jgi:hypothetical protein
VAGARTAHRRVLAASLINARAGRRGGQNEQRPSSRPIVRLFCWYKPIAFPQFRPLRNISLHRVSLRYIVIYRSARSVRNHKT